MCFCDEAHDWITPPKFAYGGISRKVHASSQSLEKWKEGPKNIGSLNLAQLQSTTCFRLSFSSSIAIRSSQAVVDIIVIEYNSTSNNALLIDAHRLSTPPTQRTSRLPMSHSILPPFQSPTCLIRTSFTEDTVWVLEESSERAARA